MPPLRVSLLIKVYGPPTQICHATRRHPLNTVSGTKTLPCHPPVPMTMRVVSLVSSPSHGATHFTRCHSLHTVPLTSHGATHFTRCHPLHTVPPTSHGATHLHTGPPTSTRGHPPPQVPPTFTGATRCHPLPKVPPTIPVPPTGAARRPGNLRQRFWD